MSTVERIAARDVADGVPLTDFLDDRATPLVIEGGARHLSAVGRFTPQYLTEKLGDVELAWKLSSSHKHPDFCAESIPKMFAREQGTLAQLIAHVTTGDRPGRARRIFTGDERFLVRRRKGETTTDPGLAPILDDVELASLVPPERLYTAWAWFSGPGVRTWLHYDNNGCHNLNAQLTGEKECELIAPSDLARVYPFVLAGGNPATNCSRVDVEAIDQDRFPLYTGAPRLVATLHTGDLLFIPAWWWHTFRHLGDFNSNVNAWWKPARPTPNATARRQVLLDLASRVGWKPGSREGDVLRQLDEAAISDAS